MLIDTHAHIHFDQFVGQVDQILANAAASGVTHIITVGVDNVDSAKATQIAAEHDSLYATVGLHPHEATGSAAALQEIADLAHRSKVVAIGECGLDYYYLNSPKADQQQALRYQIQLALELNKPLIFHVRNPKDPNQGSAFDDFWKILDEFPPVIGVVHSFSDTPPVLAQVLKRGLYVGLNGIVTFTQDSVQLDAAKAIPGDKLILETDCPFLTPSPLRGKVNTPANVRLIAQFLAKLRGESLEELAKTTTQNAKTLFGI